MSKNEISTANNVINIINTARENALRRVNEELISMYWQVGEYLHLESEKASFGDSFIDSIAEEIQNEFPGIKGFNRRGLYRMKQFYETYYKNEIVTPLRIRNILDRIICVASGDTNKLDESFTYNVRV